MGEAKAAIRRAERGLELSHADQHSFYYLSFLGLAHYADGSYEAAVEWDRKALGQNPHFRAGLRVLAASLVALGRLDEAREAARDLLREQPSFRVSAYAPHCPWQDAETRETFLRRLVEAGLPE
jgi:adenylate cyclase